MNKRITAIALSLLMVLTVLASVVPASAYVTAGPVEVRGTVADPTDANNTFAYQTDIVWEATTFAGFFYDIDDNLGTESLTIIYNVANSNGDATDLSSGDRTIYEDHLVYNTTQQPKAFEYAAFGKYDVIGFLAEPYFVGYSQLDELVYGATKEDIDLLDMNLLSGEDMSKVLIDSDDKYTIATGDGLELKEGYVLNVQQVDLEGNKALFELTKDGKVVDTEVVYPGTEDDVYAYDELDLGDENNVPTIIVRVDTVFRGTDTNVVTLEGLFQISDTLTSVEDGDTFGSLEVTTVTENTIEMMNVDDDITLNIDSVKSITDTVKFKIADDDDLRFYPFVELSEPGTYEIRGEVFIAAAGEWNKDNFAGFYYDIDDDIGTENLEILTLDDRLIDDDQLVYTTTKESKDFEFAAFGSYDVIGFLAEPFFVGYNAGLDEVVWAATKEGADLKDMNLLTGEDLSKVLIDSDDKYTIATGDGLELKEGYVLNVQQVDLEGNKALFELTKDGKVVDTEVVYPGTEDDVYAYDELDLGDENNVPVIIVRVDTVFRGTDTNVVTLEGLFQISDTLTSVEDGDTFGNLEVTSVTGDTITMDNQDNTITLSTDSVKTVTDTIKFRVADSDELRYYPFVEVTIEGETEGPVADTTPEVEVVETPVNETPVVETPVVETPVVEEEPVTAVEEPEAEEEEEAQKEPGFEAVFAVTGLLAVAFFVLRQRE